MDLMNNSTYAKNYWSFKGSNPITDDWPLFATPFPMLAIVGCYITFVLKFGPNYMRNRKAYDLKWVIRIFNLVQISHNLFMIIRGFLEPNYPSLLFSMGCYQLTLAEEQIYFNSTSRAYWHYFVNKVLDLLDTCFFVLRKKHGQITFLHVYHHITMVVVTWVIGKYYPGIEVAFFGLVNACIHVLMYIYYTAASFGDQINNAHLKYKQYLTVLQMLQFVTFLIFGTIAHYMSCGYNLFVVKIALFEGVTNLILFTNFYIKKYRKSSATKNVTKLMMCTPLQMKEHLLDENENVQKKLS